MQQTQNTGDGTGTTQDLTYQMNIQTALLA